MKFKRIDVSYSIQLQPLIADPQTDVWEFYEEADDSETAIEESVRLNCLGLCLYRYRVVQSVEYVVSSY